MPTPYIEAGSEVDCECRIGPRERVRGFLRLPDQSNSGRVRFIEDVRSQVFGDEDTAATIPLDLFGGATARTASLIDCFLSSHRFSIPFPPPYPLEAIANAVIVGSDDPDRRYERATVRSERLLDFLGSSELTLPEVAGGATYIERAHVGGDGWSLAVAEGAAVETGDTSAALRWYGELSMDGDGRPLAEWAGKLAELLLLFAFLCDKALTPERIYALEEPRAIYYYASWPRTEAPTRTEPLATLRRVDGRLAAVVQGWLRLCDGAPDLVAHVGEYQLHRNRHSLHGRALDLFRCLELYHAYSDRFQSVLRPKEDHARIVADLLVGISDDLRAHHGEWIESALTQANRKRLVDQVKDILADLGRDALESCYIADAHDFATVAKATRNYYTHPTGKPPARVPEGRDLLILVNRLWFVVRACVLMELGFSRDEVASALKRAAQRHYLLK